MFSRSGISVYFAAVFLSLSDVATARLGLKQLRKIVDSCSYSIQCIHAFWFTGERHPTYVEGDNLVVKELLVNNNLADDDFPVRDYVSDFSYCRRSNCAEEFLKTRVVWERQLALHYRMVIDRFTQTN